MYQGHSAVGPQTGLCLDRRVVRHDSGKCPGIRTKDARGDEREGQTEKST